MKRCSTSECLVGLITHCAPCVVPSDPLDRPSTSMVLLGGERELVLTPGLGGGGDGGVDTLVRWTD
eukprot:6839155-Prorocentrum_lima.AAC.1